MTRKLYNFTREPRDASYSALVDAGLSVCDKFLLVVRQTCSISAAATTLETRLRPYHLSQEDASEWPGTKLHSGSALVTYYAFNTHSASVLKSAAHGLYDWKQPDLPEDLCLLSPSGAPWLVSIAHESDAYLELTEKEYSSLVAIAPEIGSFLSPAQRSRPELAQS